MNVVESVRELFSLVVRDPSRPSSLVPTMPAERGLVVVEPEPVIIPGVVGLEEKHETLSNFLRIGRLYHPLCRNSFVERVQIGYYAYERRYEWRTCALAAAYAGAFGPQSIERPEFSYSMAIWQLSERLGFDIGQFPVIGPTGRHNNLADEMIKLVDENHWTRAGVADWLGSLGR